MTLRSAWSGPRRSMRLALLPLGLLLVAASGLFIFLLSAFPFDGLYGQDSYAYYYQARELWDGLWGTPPPDWPFVSEGLYHWPVGYHLHIMAGFLLTGESPHRGQAYHPYYGCACARPCSRPRTVYLAEGYTVPGRHGRRHSGDSGAPHRRLLSRQPDADG